MNIPRANVLLAISIFCLFAAPPGRAQSLAGPAASDSSSSREVIDAAADPAPAVSSAALTRNMPAPAVVYSHGPFSSIGVGVKLGLLGLGVEAATPLTSKLNLRLGGNFLNYSVNNLVTDGVTYSGAAHLRSAQGSIDWYPWRGSFHLSPGVLMYNGNRATANALVPAGQTFTVNDTDYQSDPTGVDPIHGNALVNLGKAGPSFTVGWGNLLPRGKRHWSIPVDLGFAYVGDPKVQLNFSGIGCGGSGEDKGCQEISTDPGFQANLEQERQKIVKDANLLRFYPIASVGFSYKF